jgi:PAS domain S-box-containing protein
MSFNLSGFPSISRYLLSTLSAVLAALLTYLLFPLIDPSVFLFFIAAVVLSAWYGGTGPGILSTALCTLMSLLFIEPLYYFAIHPQHFDRVVVFAVLSLLICFLAGRRKRQDEVLRKSEAALRESEDSLRLIASQVPAFIYTTDKELRVTSSMGMGHSLTGTSPAQFIGKTIFEVNQTADESHENVAVHLRALRGESSKYESEWMGRILESYIEPLRDTQGSIIGTIGLSVDITERKRIEDALQVSEDQFRTMADSIPQLVWMAHADGFIHWYNRRWYEYTGTKPDQMEGWGWQSVHDPESLPEVLERWNRSIATGQAFEMEFPLRGADGRFRTFLTLAQPLKDSEGRVIQWFGTNTDVDELKRAEEDLRESESRLSGLIESAMDAIITVDEAQRIVLFNRAAESTFMCQASEAVGQPIDRFIPQRFRAAHRQYIEEFGTTGVSTRVMAAAREVSGLRANGEEFPLEASISQIQVSREKLYTVILRDITERRRAEEYLRESRERFRSAFDNAAIGMALVSTEGHWLQVNQSMCEIVGYSERELLATTFQAITHPDDLAADLSHAGRTLAGEVRSYQMEKRYLHKLGHYVWALLSVSLVRDGQGNPQYFISQIQDITERKRVEEEVKTSNEQLRAISARLESAREEEGVRIARELHDELGGNMTGLKWDLQSVSTSLSSIPMEPAARTHVLGKLESMYGLIDSSLETMRRISSELRPILLDDLGLRAAVEHYVSEFRKRTGIVCDLQLRVDESHLPKKYSTPIFRILQESLTNVARHSGAKKVNILLEERDGILILEVEDNGKGLPKGETSARNSVGILGMRERARQLGGELKMTGSPGKGTKVAIVLPNLPSI